MPLILTAFIILLGLNTTFEIWLEWLNRCRVREASGSVPEPFRDFIEPETYRKTIEYTLAKSRFGLVETIFGTRRAAPQAKEERIKSGIRSRGKG